jgi:hypothetical protein
MRLIAHTIFMEMRFYGAGDRDRTGDIQLGKLAFYSARLLYVPDAKANSALCLDWQGFAGLTLFGIQRNCYPALVVFPHLLGQYGQYGQ